MRPDLLGAEGRARQSCIAARWSMEPGEGEDRSTMCFRPRHKPKGGHAGGLGPNRPPGCAIGPPPARVTCAWRPRWPPPPLLAAAPPQRPPPLRRQAVPGWQRRPLGRSRRWPALRPASKGNTLAEFHAVCTRRRGRERRQRVGKEEAMGRRNGRGGGGREAPMFSGQLPSSSTGGPWHVGWEDVRRPSAQQRGEVEPQ